MEYFSNSTRRVLVCVTLTFGASYNWRWRWCLIRAIALVCAVMNVCRSSAMVVALPLAWMQHNYKMSWYNSTTLSVVFRELGTTLHRLRASFSPGMCIVSRVPHVSSEVEKESGSNTSVADSTRDDPYNGHLVTTVPEMILYIKLSVSPTTHWYTRISIIRVSGSKEQKQC